MARRAGTSTRNRAPLSRDRVVQAAIALADEGGIEALSMRKLGKKLGVEAMSLYNHVANKDDLHEGILDVLASEITLPPSGGDWKAIVRQRAISAHAVLLRHSWASPLWATGVNIGSTRMRYVESVLRSFREGGFSPELTHHAYHVLEGHIVGYTLQEVSFAFNAQELAVAAAAFIREHADQFPYIAEHARYHVDGSAAGEESEFEFGLDLLLDGFERLRDTT